MFFFNIFSNKSTLYSTLKIQNVFIINLNMVKLDTLDVTLLNIDISVQTSRMEVCLCNIYVSFVLFTCIFNSFFPAIFFRYQDLLN